MAKGKPVEYIYLGRLIDDFGNIKHKFRNAKNEFAYFKNISKAIIGESYPITDGSILTRPQRCDKQTLSLTDDEIRSSNANEQVVKYTVERRKKMAKIKKPHPDLVRAIQLLTPFYYELNHLSARRLTDYIHNEISAELFKRIKKIRKENARGKRK